MEANIILYHLFFTRINHLHRLCDAWQPKFGGVYLRSVNFPLSRELSIDLHFGRYTVLLYHWVEQLWYCAYKFPSRPIQRVKRDLRIEDESTYRRTRTNETSDFRIILLTSNTPEVVEVNIADGHIALGLGQFISRPHEAATYRICWTCGSRGSTVALLEFDSQVIIFDVHGIVGDVIYISKPTSNTI